MQPGGRLNVESVPLRFLIMFAYDIKEFQIFGGPSWINSDLYNITAKPAGNAPMQQVRVMVQSLLADRFGLTLHRETKELPVYDLEAAKSGIKLAASKEGSCVTPDPNNPPRPGEPRPRFCGNIGMQRGLLEAYGIPLPRLLAALSDLLGRPVIDKAGITGTFDIHLEFTPDEATANGPGQGNGPPGDPAARPAPPAEPTAPSIFTALQEQLGLRVESAKGPVEVLVIDHVQRPSEN
jgi:uncharacterized protein (TIGR03435 family)